jgi:serine/threonine protein kinase
MPLLAGTCLGPYEILTLIGKGGMGEVYRARDMRLGREVAIKVAAEQFSERFEREARAIAALNHPNICQLYDVGPNYLVMELIEGESPKGPLPVETALGYARQIADALDAAHEIGIVHRDLKPANIKIKADGTVKVLDFGLAKIGGTPTAKGEDSPTLTLAATQTGMILGTAAYMSPEQARGKPVDRRADIWAFGVVLYEMLTGKRLFQGDDITDTLAAVLRHEPDWEQVPAKVRRLLRRCLAKDPAKRLRDIGDAWELLEEAPQATAPSPSQFGYTGWIVAGALAVVALGISFVHLREKPPASPVLRTTILPPDKTTFDFANSAGTVVVSPDGKRLVFAATSEDGKSQLWVRPLDALTAQPLLGTNDAKWPFWSPDSRFVAFFADAKLKKIDILGGPPIALANAPNGRGGAWSPEGVIVFAPENNGGLLLKISAAGGDPSPAANLDRAKGESQLKFPWFLPDARHFLYLGQKSAGVITGNIDLGFIDSLEHKILTQADSKAVYSEGHLLFLRENTLMAQPFDLKRLKTAGEAVPVAEQVQHVLGGGRDGVFSVSNSGLLAYQAGAAAANGMKLIWFDRTGKPTGTLGEAAEFEEAQFSPDRKSLAATIVGPGGNPNIWIYDVARGLPTRFTFDSGADSHPVWSPDGRTILFASNRKGHYDIYRRASNGTGDEEPLYADGTDKFPLSWSPDGKFLLYRAVDRQTLGDLWVLPMIGAPKPVPFLRTAANEPLGQFSPDGRWVAYQSNESQRPEIYIAPFPGPGGKRQISTNLGVYPRWRSDGKEIFYVGPGDQRLMAAEVIARGDTLEVGQVRSLPIGPIPIVRLYPYDVSADGQRILAFTAPLQKSGEPLTLVQNWAAGFKK